MDDADYEYRKIHGLIGEASFSIVLPKKYATDIGLTFVSTCKSDELEWLLYMYTKPQKSTKNVEASIVEPD